MAPPPPHASRGSRTSDQPVSLGSKRIPRLSSNFRRLDLIHKTLRAKPSGRSRVGLHQTKTNKALQRQDVALRALSWAKLLVLEANLLGRFETESTKETEQRDWEGEGGMEGEEEGDSSGGSGSGSDKAESESDGNDDYHEHYLIGDKEQHLNEGVKSKGRDLANEFADECWNCWETIRNDKTLKPFQLQTLKSLLTGDMSSNLMTPRDGRPKDTILVSPTGSGKSAVYGRLASEAPGGFVLVISPTVALMLDQGAKFDDAIVLVGGFREALGRGGRNDDVLPSLFCPVFCGDKPFEQAFRTLVGRRSSLLFISPERASSPNTWILLSLLSNPYGALMEGSITWDGAPTTKLKPRKCSFVVIDEAHCILDWGESFRPAYLRQRRLLSFLKLLNPQVPPITLLLTATLTRHSIPSVLSTLGLDHNANVVYNVELPKGLIFHMLDTHKSHKQKDSTSYSSQSLSTTAAPETPALVRLAKHLRLHLSAIVSAIQKQVKDGCGTTADNRSDSRGEKDKKEKREKGRQISSVLDKAPFPCIVFVRSIAQAASLETLLIRSGLSAMVFAGPGTNRGGGTQGGQSGGGDVVGVRSIYASRPTKSRTPKSQYVQGQYNESTADRARVLQSFARAAACWNRQIEGLKEAEANDHLNGYLASNGSALVCPAPPVLVCTIAFSLGVHLTMATAGLQGNSVIRLRGIFQAHHPSTPETLIQQAGRGSSGLGDPGASCVYVCLHSRASLSRVALLAAATPLALCANKVCEKISKVVEDAITRSACVEGVVEVVFDVPAMLDDVAAAYGNNQKSFKEESEEPEAVAVVALLERAGSLMRSGEECFVDVGGRCDDEGDDESCYLLTGLEVQALLPRFIVARDVLDKSEIAFDLLDGEVARRDEGHSYGGGVLSCATELVRKLEDGLIDAQEEPRGLIFVLHVAVKKINSRRAAADVGKVPLSEFLDSIAASSLEDKITKLESVWEIAEAYRREKDPGKAQRAIRKELKNYFEGVKGSWEQGRREKLDDVLRRVPGCIGGKEDEQLICRDIRTMAENILLAHKGESVDVNKWALAASFCSIDSKSTYSRMLNNSERHPCAPLGVVLDTIDKMFSGEK